MKKYALGIAVALIFVAYSSVLRNQRSIPIVAPSTDTSGKGNSSTASSNNGSTAAGGSNGSSPSTQSSSAQLKDGTYTGSVENAFYGNVQVSATIQNGIITAVNFLKYPNDNPNSINVNQQAMPYLKQEAVQAQSANVSIVTGATFTSQAFMQSLASALAQAK